MKTYSIHKKIIWNMLGSLCNAFSSMILLIVVNRTTNAYNGGLFSLGFATAQMMTTLGTLEVRNYQATDVKDEFSFNDYYSFRIFTCVFMLICSVAYLFVNHFTIDKIIITALLCFYKMTEAFSDVFEGLYQQKNRIDLSGKSMFFRVIISTIVFVGVIGTSKDMILATVFMSISALLFTVFYNKYITEKYWFHFKIKFNFYRWRKLARQCLPLAVGAFLILYMGNAPKYAVDFHLGEESQNVFSIIFMPAFIINLFSLLAFRPMLTPLAYSWELRDIKRFLTVIGKAFIWLAVVLVICLLGAYTLGIPILSILYGINLQAYKQELVIIMIGGGINAFATILRFTLTVIRQQMSSMWGYVISLLATVIVCPELVKRYSIAGACYSYIVSMAIMGIVFGIILIKSLLKFRKINVIKHEKN